MDTSDVVDSIASPCLHLAREFAHQSTNQQNTTTTQHMYTKILHNTVSATFWRHEKQNEWPTNDAGHRFHLVLIKGGLRPGSSDFTT